MRLIYKFSEDDFIRVSSDMLKRAGTTVFEDLYASLCHLLSSPVDELGVVNEVKHRYKPEYYDKNLSLPEYIENGFLEFYYPSIDFYSDKDNPIDIEGVKLPGFIKIKSIEYGDGVKKTIKVKSHNLKTKNRVTIEILHLIITKETLKKIYGLVKHYSAGLIPSKLGVWEWRQTFYNKITGECFFCDCFKEALKRENGISGNPHVVAALNKKSFKKGICHLCSGTNSDLFYCHPMYASSFKVKYGAYIRKLEIEKGLSERDAENIVRKLKGVAKIGEKWIHETLLFNYIDVMFSNYSVEREASPDWLGNQRLDIYIPELKLAIEYQGQQHFKAVGLFGGKEGLAKTKRRDKDKFIKCKNNGINLVYFTYKDNLSEKLVNSRLKKYVTEKVTGSTIT